MRYSLRNKAKINVFLGDSIYFAMIESLDKCFTTNNFKYYRNNSGYDVIVVGCNTYIFKFYVLSQRYDVVNLAFNKHFNIKHGSKAKHPSSYH